MPKRRFKVRFEEKPYEVEVSINRTSSTNISMTVTIEGKKYNVSISRETTTPSIKEEKKKIQVKPSGKEFIVKSPLPGKILSVSVSPGKEVLQGDILLVMESMKMENEIRSPVKGVVKEVKVRVGESVSTEDTLVVLVRSG
ncbi:MAG: acetyl-CoA carboxylase biotin carboxyl carrier protein subunit [Candidatus Hecatellales archaeon]|nr:MAG: acetyl-CoA carboxylase biotin carboxyl carrier protein subunit [Candidatus Hecatellales archaeon]